MNREPWMDKYEAPEGAIWICAACGKKNRNRAMVGDESCFLNAVLIYDRPPKPTLNGPEYEAFK